MKPHQGSRTGRRGQCVLRSVSCCLELVGNYPRRSSNSRTPTWPNSSGVRFRSTPFGGSSQHPNPIDSSPESCASMHTSFAWSPHTRKTSSEPCRRDGRRPLSPDRGRSFTHSRRNQTSWSQRLARWPIASWLWIHHSAKPPPRLSVQAQGESSAARMLLSGAVGTPLIGISGQTDPER
jgi:hypothetical protein